MAIYSLYLPIRLHGVILNNEVPERWTNKTVCKVLESDTFQIMPLLCQQGDVTFQIPHGFLLYYLSKGTSVLSWHMWGKRRIVLCVCVCIKVNSYFISFCYSSKFDTTLRCINCFWIKTISMASMWHLALKPLWTFAFWLYPFWHWLKFVLERSTRIQSP